MLFEIEIEGEDKLAGITAAREKHNADAGEVVFTTNQQYVEFVMNKAAESYANTYVDN